MGSGLMEREVALVINRRLKQQGMRWCRANADAVVVLRAQIPTPTGRRRPHGTGPPSPRFLVEPPLTLTLTVVQERLSS